MRNFLLFLSLAVPVMFSSCSKDKDNTPSKTKMLTTQSWKLIAAVSEDNQMSGPKDEYELLKACNQDDLYEFSSDNTYTYEEGATKCDPGDPQISDAGNWELADKDTKLTITSAAKGPIEYDVIELTASRLVIKMYFDYDLGGGDRYTGTYTATYQAQ